MSDHLDKRGTPVEVVFGFLDDTARRLALVPATFLANVRLEGDARGIVRCRLGGLPAVLVPAAEGLHVDVAGLAARWPHWVSELIEVADEASARALLTRKPLVEVRPAADWLKDLILTHEIRAEHLYLLGDRSSTRALPSGDELVVAIELPLGTLELAIPRDVCARAIETRALAPDPKIRVVWQGSPLELPTDELAWHEDDFAELAVIVSMQLEKGARAEVLRLLESALPDGGDKLELSLALGTILSVWGVVYRQTGALERAIATLERVHAFAKGFGPELEQEVSYNLGYAKLETTMKSRMVAGLKAGHEHVAARYEMHESHRALWNECLALFERALELDPDDATARSQVDQVNRLLAVLDLNKRGDARPATSSAPPSRTTSGGNEQTPEINFWRTTIGLSLVVVVFVGIAVIAWRCRNEDRARPPTATAPEPVRPPPRDVNAPRRAAFAALIKSGTLPAGNGRPCSITVAVPDAIPRGTVVAPHLGRAIGTGELYGTEHFDATIRNWASLYASGLEVRPAHPLRTVGPITGDEGVASRYGLSRTPITLVVSEWRDPVVGKNGTRGHIAGHALVWSAKDRRFVCVGSFEADNAPVLEVVSSADFRASQDDPLNRARLDLVEQATRAAIPRLETLAEGR